MPFQEDSSIEPNWSLVGPDTVPDANRSPALAVAPFTVAWASCWSIVQYMELNDGSNRTFLEDGDTVAITGICAAPGEVQIGFGRCEGTVVA